MLTPETIHMARKALGLTQVEFAARIGVDPVTVSRWERGISTPQSRGIKIVLGRLIRRAINGSGEAQSKSNKKTSPMP